MHGLINRSIQCFVQDTYGAELWADVAADAGLRAEGFEALLIYDDALTEAVLTSVSRHQKKSREVVLEDLGTFLVSHANLEPLRRLLRFGGENFMEFLHSLDDLADRARLAVPDLDLPDMEIVDEGPSTFRLLCRWHFAGSGHVMLGILRAMADDYGALVLLEYLGEAAGRAEVQVELLDCRFAEGRSFKLAMPAG